MPCDLYLQSVTLLCSVIVHDKKLVVIDSVYFRFIDEENVDVFSSILIGGEFHLHTSSWIEEVKLIIVYEDFFLQSLWWVGSINYTVTRLGVGSV